LLSLLFNISVKPNYRNNTVKNNLKMLEYIISYRSLMSSMLYINED
jgi:hypothetical protein